MRTATVQEPFPTPQGASQDGSRASFIANVIWKTAVLGNIERSIQPISPLTTAAGGSFGMSV